MSSAGRSGYTMRRLDVRAYAWLDVQVFRTVEDATRAGSMVFIRLACPTASFCHLQETKDVSGTRALYSAA